MYEIIEGQVLRTENSTIPYTWIRSKEPAKSICIMLPGLGYTTQRPLFHYSTGICLNQNIDVLHINYQFANNEHFKKLPGPEHEQWMYDDIKAVVDEVLKERSYDQCFLLSKSIGTIPMAMEWKQRNFIHNAIGIWLTPLIKMDKVYQALLNTELPSLCIIGDLDHHYNKEKISAIITNHLVDTVVIPNTEHSLEVKGDTLATIDALKEAVKHIEAFVENHKI
ncbi:alpha/beta family hydrolase [Neobacillus sp. GCM10023253]|uniref:alpha/beta family hydrolase n=1 Tax=Neobacillus sp. GCM10023253 TaxID=3252644 RepID=UPI00360770E3